MAVTKQAVDNSATTFNLQLAHAYLVNVEFLLLEYFNGCRAPPHNRRRRPQVYISYSVPTKMPQAPQLKAVSTAIAALTATYVLVPLSNTGWNQS